jgi:2-methylisocitrate lyase-like PEP mutase family enzyme
MWSYEKSGRDGCGGTLKDSWTHRDTKTRSWAHARQVAHSLHAEPSCFSSVTEQRPVRSVCTTAAAAVSATAAFDFRGSIAMILSRPSTSDAPLPVGAHDAASQVALTARLKTFRALHQQGCFVIPNPWDVGSARYLQHLGFPALATTSAGFAFSQGFPDTADEVLLSRDRTLSHIAEITASVDLPVNADFMSGYGLGPEDVAESVSRCVATGAAGLSIEDATGDPTSPLYELPIAVERVLAAREAIDRSGHDVLLTARAECYHVGHPDPLRESVRRLQAYASAGADVLFAPGVQNPAEIKALVDAIAPKPLNLLVVRDIALNVEDVAALGVRRISVGGALALAAWTGFMRAARTLRSEGSFAGLASLVPYAEINGLFDPNRREQRALTDQCGRSESLDPDNVGDIADEGQGHRG